MSDSLQSDNDIFRLVQNKDWEAILQLIETGRLQPNTKLVVQFIAEQHTVPLLPYFVGAGATEVVRRLLEKGAKPNQRYEGQTPLLYAVGSKDHEVVEMLLSAGADLEATVAYGEGEGGETALMLASENHDVWAVERLLKAGANATKATSKKVRTAIWCATSTDYKSKTAERIHIIRILTNAGCKLLGNELHWPVFHRDRSLVDLLVELGCPVNVTLSHGEPFGPRKGDTPLTVAVEWCGTFDVGAQNEQSSKSRSLVDLITALLGAGADPNIPNGKGETPLWRTVFGSDFEIAETLLAAGADPNLCPENCKLGSALDFAKKRDFPEFVKLFEGTSP